MQCDTVHTKYLLLAYSPVTLSLVLSRREKLYPFACWAVDHWMQQIQYLDGNRSKEKTYDGLFGRIR